jgi:hypothetical protein
MTASSETLLASTNLTQYFAAGGDPASAENQRIVGDLAQREMFFCASSLFSNIASAASEHGKFGTTSYEEILGLLQGPADYEAAAREVGWQPIEEMDESILREVYDHAVGKSGKNENEDYPSDLRDDCSTLGTSSS